MNMTLPHFPQFFKQSTDLEVHTEPEVVTTILVLFTQVTSEKCI